MLSFFSRYTQKSNLYNNTYDTNLQKYIRKIEADLLKKPVLTSVNTDIILHNPMYTGYNLLPISIIGFICFLAGYKLSKV